MRDRGRSVAADRQRHSGMTSSFEFVGVESEDRFDLLGNYAGPNGADGGVCRAHNLLVSNLKTDSTYSGITTRELRWAEWGRRGRLPRTTQTTRMLRADGIGARNEESFGLLRKTET